MTDIPQLGPEVYVDDENDIAKQAKTSVHPLLSPVDINSQSPFFSHGLDGARRQQAADAGVEGSGGSPGISPRLSPHRPTNSAFSFEGGDYADPGGSADSSRRGSAVSAENVLEVLDNSAWGESIRRSFTMRRPNNRSSS
jgi:hypothetical protein